MLPDEKIIMGVAGTAVSAVGAGMSVTELQSIISIIITIAGFVISVLIPLIIKIVKKIKAAKEDGIITPEEAEEIKSDIKLGSSEVIKQGKEIIEKIKEEKEKK